MVNLGDSNSIKFSIGLLMTMNTNKYSKPEPSKFPFSISHFIFPFFKKFFDEFMIRIVKSNHFIIN